MSKTISVHNMFSTCSELGVFMYWTCKSMNNPSSYCGLVDAKIGASDKNLTLDGIDKISLQVCLQIGFCNKYQ